MKTNILYGTEQNPFQCMRVEHARHLARHLGRKIWARFNSNELSVDSQPTGKPDLMIRFDASGGIIERREAIETDGKR